MTSHPAISVLYAAPNDMHDSATTMFVTCKMVSIKLIRNRSIRCKQSLLDRINRNFRNDVSYKRTYRAHDELTSVGLTQACPKYSRYLDSLQ